MKQIEVNIDRSTAYLDIFCKFFMDAFFIGPGRGFSSIRPFPLEFKVLYAPSIISLIVLELNVYCETAFLNKVNNKYKTEERVYYV